MLKDNEQELLCIGGHFHGWTTKIENGKSELTMTDQGKDFEVVEYNYTRIRIAHEHGAGDALVPSEIMPRVHGCVRGEI